MGLPVAVSSPSAEVAPQRAQNPQQMERRQVSRRKHRKSKENDTKTFDVDENATPDEPSPTSLITSLSPPPSPTSGAERLAEALPALHLTNGTNGDSEHSPPASPVSTLSAHPHLAPSVESNQSRPASEGCELCGSPTCTTPGDIRFESYQSELQMADIMKLIQKDLSEPYSIYTYRYFIHNWPKLCFLAVHDAKCIGAIVCKLDLHRTVKRGYIAMLAVDEKYRKRKIGSKLVTQAILVIYLISDTSTIRSSA